MVEALDRYHANASSTHSLGQECRYAVEESRRVLANVLEADPTELVFTASASESNLMALWGLWLARTKQDPRRRTIITSPLEHNSVYENILFLKDTFDARVVYAPLNEKGEIDQNAFRDLIKNPDEIAFVSMIGAHNEVGIVQPWQDLAEECFQAGIPFHVDLVQCFLREPLKLRESKASAVTLCFHKAGGPKGVGLLYIRNKTQMEPLIRGGSQEKKRRAGTENVVAIVGAGALAEEASILQVDYEDSVRKTRDFFEAEMKSRRFPVRIVGENTRRIPNTSYVLFDGLRSDVLMMQLDLSEICVSSGSACSSGIPTPSRALLKLGYSEAEALSGLRFSLGPQNTRDEALKVLEVLGVALSKKKVA